MIISVYFTHHAPVLWNYLPKQLRQPSTPPSLGTATDSSPLLALSSHHFTLNSKPFYLNNPFLLSLVCTNSCRFSGPLTLLTVFISQSFSPCRSFSHRSSTPVSVNKPLSVVAAWQALCRHSKSSHWSSFTMVSGAIIIIIIMIFEGVFLLLITLIKVYVIKLFINKLTTTNYININSYCIKVY